MLFRSPAHRPGPYGYLLDNGHLFYCGKIEDGVKRFPAWERFKAGVVLEVDWNGKTVWEVRHPDHHHDARKLRNGNVILLCLRPLPTELHARVKGGLPGTEVDGTIYADFLLEVTTSGLEHTARGSACSPPRRGGRRGPRCDDSPRTPATG